jgi:putative transport protein
VELVFVFLIAAIGYLIGSIKIKGIELGTAGVLLVALVFGHFGVEIPGFVSNLGIALFVTSVGFIAGPKFFRNLRKNATSYVLLGVIVILAGTLASIAVIKFGGIPAGLATGLFAGALTSTPGLAAAVEAASEAEAQLVSVGYGVAYPFGVIGVVMFVQLIPKLLKADLVREREMFEAANAVEIKSYDRKLINCDPMGMMAFAAAVVLGVLIGRVSVPLPGGAEFALGTSGGPLISGLIFGHFAHIGPINLKVKNHVLEVFREFGLVLFLIGAGVKGGQGFVEVLKTQGVMLFVYGAVITTIPMLAGYLFASKVLKLNLFNNLGSICGGMTSTPALGTLISVTGTSDIATAYAATYPMALVLVVLSAQFMNIIF